jgi:hypothetical protein
MKFFEVRQNAGPVLLKGTMPRITLPEWLDNAAFAIEAESGKAICEYPTNSKVLVSLHHQ